MNPDVVEVALGIAFWVNLLLIAVCLIVVAVGPTSLDRVIALDMSVVMSAVSLGIFSALAQSSVYVNAALVVAVLAQMTTVMLARFIETGNSR